MLALLPQPAGDLVRQACEFVSDVGKTGFSIAHVAIEVPNSSVETSIDFIGDTFAPGDVRREAHEQDALRSLFSRDFEDDSPQPVDITSEVHKQFVRFGHARTVLAGNRESTPRPTQPEQVAA